MHSSTFTSHTNPHQSLLIGAPAKDGVLTATKQTISFFDVKYDF